METKKVGIREFRDNLSDYLLNSQGPVAITRHGDTVGTYVPVRRNRTEEQRIALREATDSLHKEMAAKGITEDDILKDFEEFRKRGRAA
jgi:antitoxin (DNA-binding transcriptional repressor) of toxin-antitoxin stability system